MRRARLASVRSGRPGSRSPGRARDRSWWTLAQAERRQLAQHVGAVRGRPVEAPAARAGEEALVPLVDEGRHAALGALARHFVEHAVAVEATPEERRAADGDRGGDLAELLAKVVAGHEQVRRQLG